MHIIYSYANDTCFFIVKGRDDVSVCWQKRSRAPHYSDNTFFILYYTGKVCWFAPDKWAAYSIVLILHCVYIEQGGDDVLVCSRERGSVEYHAKICKRCSLECDMGKYSTRSMNKVWAFRRTPCSLNMCCIFTYGTKNGQSLYFLTRSSHTWHMLPYIVLNLQLECDMGWYRYTSHSENQYRVWE